MAKKQFDIISIIASRKAEFYIGSKKKLLSSLPKSIDKKDAMLRLRHAIAELDNTLFISEEEKSSMTINPESSISQLNLNKKEIVNQTLKAILSGR